ncbi:MAG: glycosyltransferase [Rhodospirillum sp.]|nr:glycosyltransferase [Rhodospirillum sp.]MCF8487621.1 glycosyltransferase [Rhodospirillum sp.]MCF8499225.1 glycosyltransferase [Rhodospirillum sp.]
MSKLSIITTTKNSAHTLEEAIQSVQFQRFSDYEHIVVDGASTDGTQALLDRYDHLRWISEPDSCMLEGFRKGLAMATGEYIGHCCASDGYMSRNWFARAVAALDADPRLSLVWGGCQYMEEDGGLIHLWWPVLLDRPPPKGEAFLGFWFATRLWYPEINYIVRRSVFEDCFPSAERNDLMSRANPFLEMVLNFNLRGYQSTFIPIVAAYGRLHPNSQTEINREDNEKTVKDYVERVDAHRRAIFRGGEVKTFRSGSGAMYGEMSSSDILALGRVMEACERSYPVAAGRSPSAEVGEIGWEGQALG